MFHTMCIAVVVFGLSKLGIAETNPILFNLLLYGLSIAATIAVSALSFNYFEKWFLKWKDGFTVVKSGNSIAKSNTSKEPIVNPTTDSGAGVRRAA